MKKLSTSLVTSAFAVSLLLPLGAAAMEGGMMRGRGEKNVTNVDGTCMQNAVEKRDAAMIAAFDAFHTSAAAALTTRKTALKDAWGKTGDERKAALKDAWKTFQDSWKMAAKTLREAKKTAWKTFRTEAKACGGTSSADTSSENEGAEVNIQ
jgi:hypothetical protein